MRKVKEETINMLPWFNLLGVVFVAGGVYAAVATNTQNISKMNGNFDQKFNQVLIEQSTSNKELVKSINGLNITMAMFSEQMENRDNDILNLKRHLEKHDLKIDIMHDDILLLQNHK